MHASHAPHACAGLCAAFVQAVVYVAGLAALAMRHIETARQQVRGGMEECGLREKPSRWVWCWEVREIV